MSVVLDSRSDSQIQPKRNSGTSTSATPSDACCLHLPDETLADFADIETVNGFESHTQPIKCMRPNSSIYCQ